MSNVKIAELYTSCWSQKLKRMANIAKREVEKVRNLQ